MELADDQWVLLAYRLPREPSTPRAAVWRKLRRLGVAQITDGLVALPADARTREYLEWVAEEVVDHGGEATVWLAHPDTSTATAALTHRMTAAVAAEYRAVTKEAGASRHTDSVTRRRVLQRLRRELDRIHQRDYFPTPERDTARAAVEELATSSADEIRR